MENKFGIFFDLDGTLVDNEHLKAFAFSEAIKKFGGDSDPSIYKEVMGIDGLSIRKHFIAKANLTINLDKYFEVFKSIYENLLHTELSVKPGALQFLDELKSKAIKMALISSTYSTSVNFIVNGLNLGSYFKVINHHPEFLSGSLYVVGFNDTEGKMLQNYVYIEGNDITVYKNSALLDELVARKSKKTGFSSFIETLGGMAGIIGLLITGTIIWRLIKDPKAEVPQILSAVLTTILGFYFGTKASK